MLQSGLTVLEERVNPLDTELLNKEHSAGTSLTMATIRGTHNGEADLSTEESELHSPGVPSGDFLTTLNLGGLLNAFSKKNKIS